MTGVAAELPLPDELFFAELRLDINADSEGAAREIAEGLFRDLRAAFAKSHPELMLLYDLDIRINGVVAASFHIFAPVGLVLKAGWRKVRQITPKGYIVVAGIMGAIAGYPQLKQGAGELYKDLNSGFHYVIDGHQKTNPEVIKGGECIYNLKPPGDNEA